MSKRIYSLTLSLMVAASFGIGYGISEWVHPTQVIAQDAAAPTLKKLNSDFIEISESVTPAVVSIAMIKRAKAQQPKQLDPNNPDDFFDFFGKSFPQSPNQGEERSQQGVGSGVIVDAEKGYILTNNHVVEGADEIRVTLTDRRSFKAKIVGTDPRSDLAVIKLESFSNLQQVTLGDSSRLQVGEWVLAIGNPFGLDSTVTAGIISAKSRNNVGVADFEDFLQTDAAINPGNSGGALVNIKGELVGINTAIATRSRGYMGIGFAIPSDMAREVMKSLISQGKVKRSQLGVFIQQLDAALAESLGISANQGILVSGVSPGSAADKAGLKKYDIISRLDGKVVLDSNQFRNKIALTPPGSKIEIEILRNQKPQKFTVTLEEADSQSENAQAPDLGALSQEKDLVVQDLSSDLRQRYRIEASAKGVVVSDVNSNGPAFEKGLRPGDLITEINRQTVASAQSFNQIYQKLKSGDTVLLAVQRQGGSLVVAFRIP